jgi:GT2 family glycosyltransferase
VSGSDIAVVICTHTLARWDDLERAVASVETQSSPAAELIVAVDHNPQLLERARSAFAHAQVLPNEGTAGLAGARNTAAKASSAPIVAFLDDDAVAESDWLERLAEVFESEEVIGAGGAVLPLWPDHRPAWFPEEFDWVVGCTHRGMPRERTVVRTFVGANMAFRRSVFDEVLFYSGIGHSGGSPLGGSDPDFCIRVRTRWPDRLLVYDPRAAVSHLVSVDRTRWRYFLRRCLNEGLAKGLLTHRVGWDDALQTERVYVRKTLPGAVAGNLAQAFAERRPQRALAAGAVLAGLAVTSAGYAAGLLRRREHDHLEGRGSGLIGPNRSDAN